MHSLAFGKDSRRAALGSDAWLDDGKGWKKLPSPPGPLDDVHVYFGRDAQPRLMGFAGGTGIYLRFQNGVWKSGASEIGRLGAGPPAPLFGVLGYDDPEVVCKVGEQCIIKRLTGWTTFDAPGGLFGVVLSRKLAWAFEGQRLLILEAKGWRAFAERPSFEHADAVWGPSETDVWVVEHASSTVHHFDGKSWTRMASAVSGPRAIWSSSTTDVWVGADGGAAHFDGKGFRRVRGAPEHVVIVNGGPMGEVWFAGGSGVWRGQKRD